MDSVTCCATGIDANHLRTRRLNRWTPSNIGLNGHIWGLYFLLSCLTTGNQVRCWAVFQEHERALWRGPTVQRTIKQDKSMHLSPCIELLVGGRIFKMTVKVWCYNMQPHKTTFGLHEADKKNHVRWPDVTAFPGQFWFEFFLQCLNVFLQEHSFVLVLIMICALANMISKATH